MERRQLAKCVADGRPLEQDLPHVNNDNSNSLSLSPRVMLFTNIDPREALVIHCPFVMKLRTV